MRWAAIIIQKVKYCTKIVNGCYLWTFSMREHVKQEYSMLTSWNKRELKKREDARKREEEKKKGNGINMD